MEPVAAEPGSWPSYGGQQHYSNHSKNLFRWRASKQNRERSFPVRIWIVGFRNNHRAEVQTWTHNHLGNWSTPVGRTKGLSLANTNGSSASKRAGAPTGYPRATS